jgi:hypothetical protein
VAVCAPTVATPDTARQTANRNIRIRRESTIGKLDE